MSRWSVAATGDRAVTYVLGGGAALGARQVGHLQVLEDQGWRPDAVMGSSVGALNAAVVAARPEGAAARLAAIWKGLRRVDVFPVSPAPPWGGGSVLAPDGLRLLITRGLGGEGIETFEDLVVPLAVIATDADTGAPVVIEQGPLAPALMASAAMPLLLPPVQAGGRRLIDGGRASLLPVGIAERRGARTVVALPAATPDRWDRRRAARRAGLLTGVTGPHAHGVQARVVDLSGARPVRWRGCLGFRRTEELVAIGRAEATAALLGPGAREHGPALAAPVPMTVAA